MMEKSDREILVRTQDGMRYIKFKFPLEVMDAETASREYWDMGLDGYVLFMGCENIGSFKEKKHAIHVMNYLLAKRNYYLFDSSPKIKSVILNVPTDELVRQTADEDLLNGVPTRGDNDESNG